MKYEFHFSKLEQKKWRQIAINAYGVIRGFLCGTKEFEIEIRPVSKKRSNQQLKTYWRLVDLITEYMNEQGNFFSSESVSNWIKISAGHFQEIEGEKMARSIADKSDATVADMKKIIDFMLHFGIEHNIKGCEISEPDRDALLRFYE